MLVFNNLLVLNRDLIKEGMKSAKMNMNLLNKLLTLDVKCKHKLKEYVKFCLDNDSTETKVDRHHILPRAVFEEYSNFTNNPWNMTRLSYKNHYIAHSLLHEAVNHYSIASAWYAMNNKNYKKYNGETLLGAELYSKLITKRNKQASEFNKDKVMAKCLTTGVIVRVPRDEFLLDDNLVGHTKGFGGEHLRGTMAVLGENGQTIKIPVEDYDPNIHIGHTKGFTTFKNNQGEIIHAAIDDPRVLSGELFGVTKGNRFKNPAAKGQYIKLGIFDKDGVMVHECYGNFVSICKEYKLPIQRLRKTRSENNTITFDFTDSRPEVVSRIINSGVMKYEGWYVRRLT